MPSLSRIAVQGVDTSADSNTGFRPAISPVQVPAVESLRIAGQTTGGVRRAISRYIPA
jgi:hypothetical protein